MDGARREADLAQAVLRGLPQMAPARVDERQLDVLPRVGIGEEVELLEDEAEEAVPRRRELIVAEAGEIHPARAVRALVGPVQTSDDVEEGGLPGA